MKRKNWMLGSTNLFVRGDRYWRSIIVALVVLAELAVLNACAEGIGSASESADLGNKVQQLVETGKFEQALEIVEGLAQNYSTRPLAGRLLVWIRDKQGQGKRAEEDLKRWQQAYPNDSGMAILLAWYYRKSGQPAKAREMLIEALQKNRRFLVAYRALASLEAEQGRRAQAVKWLAKMVQARNSAIDDAQWRVIDIAGSKTEAAKLLNELRREKGLARDFSLAWAVGTVAETAQMSDEAVLYYRGAIKLQPRFGQLYVYLVKLQLRQGRADQAMEVIGEAEKAKAEGVSFYQLEGLAYLLKDDLESAIVSLEAAVGVEPSDAAAREALASVLLAVGRPDEAAKQLATLVGGDSAKQSVYGELMEAYLADGRAQRAAEVAAKVMAGQRLEPTTALTAAQAFLEAKKPEQALKILESVSVRREHKELWQVLLVEALLSGEKHAQALQKLEGWLEEMPTVDKRAELAARMATVLAQTGEKAMAIELASRELT
ncbi:MAG: tetratricopeptide repeat protein, partial [Phycisphaerae bacterium]|nr:tetratricopeptide repeat protein [Phycisphaerae bacterium]